MGTKPSKNKYVTPSSSKKLKVESKSGSKCYKCGAKLNASDKFCNQCGNKVINQAEMTEMQPGQQGYTNDGGIEPEEAIPYHNYDNEIAASAPSEPQPAYHQMDVVPMSGESEGRVTHY